MRERQMFKQADDGYWYVINNPAPAGSPAAEFWAQPFVLDKIDDDYEYYHTKDNNYRYKSERKEYTFLEEHNNELTRHNDLAAYIHSQVDDAADPYAIDDDIRALCDDVIKVYTYHHEQLKPWPYGKLVYAETSPCRHGDDAYMLAMLYQRDDGKQIYLLYPQDVWYDDGEEEDYYYTITLFYSGELFDPAEVIDCGYDDNDFVTFYTDGAYLLKADETLDREIMDTSYMHYK